MEDMFDSKLQCKIAGINHQAWLLEVRKNGQDLYPEIKRRAFAMTQKHNDMIRFEMMRRFGYYVTESSEHNAEYMPFFIKDKYPELIERYNIPLGRIPPPLRGTNCHWNKQRDALTNDPDLSHTRTSEYASYIMEAMETNVPYKIAATFSTKD